MDKTTKVILGVSGLLMSGCLVGIGRAYCDICYRQGRIDASRELRDGILKIHTEATKNMDKKIERSSGRYPWNSDGDNKDVNESDES